MAVYTFAFSTKSLLSFYVKNNHYVCQILESSTQNLGSSLNIQGIDWELYIQHCVHG